MDRKIRFFSIVALLLIWLVTGCTSAAPEEIAVIETSAPTETAKPTEPETTAPAPTQPPTEQTEPTPTEQSKLPDGPHRWDTPALTQEMMVFTVEGMEETVPVFSWNFGTYRVSIPSEGWEFRLLEDCERWTSEYNPDVRFSVYHPEGRTQPEAIQAYAERSGYIFEDLMGGGSAEDCLYGAKWPMCCAFFAAEDGTVVAWEYPTEAAEGFGSRMHQMAATYESAE